MTDAKRTVISLTAAALWASVGLLAGVIFGLTMAFPFRLVVFMAALGLAVGWFGFTGTYGRINGKEPIRLLPQGLKAPEKPVAVPPPAPKPFRVEDHIFSPEQARQWLDDFLLKQQRK